MRHIGIPQRARRHRNPPRHRAGEHRQRHVRADAMIAAIAKMGRYDVNSDQVQTLVYMCLTGSTIADIVKETGIQISTKSLTEAIKKIPGAVLTKINQKIGFRFLTKFGKKGVINLGKLVPIAGGLVGGGRWCRLDHRHIKKRHTHVHRGRNTQRARTKCGGNPHS